MSREWPKVCCPHCGGSLENAGGVTAADLRTMREDAGLGLREMSRLSGASAAYLAHMETGQRPVALWAPALYRQTLEAHAAALVATSERIRGALKTQHLDTSAEKDTPEGS